MPLTDTAIRNAKPAERRRKLYDGGGLHVEISPKGIKTWKLDYRFDGKQNTITGGRYPEPMPLAVARGWREEVKAKLRAGIDPAAEVKQVRRGQQREGKTFETVATDWIEDQAHLSERYRKWLLQRFEADVFPLLGAKGIASIDSDDILDLIHYFEERDTIPMGRKVLRYVNKVCAHAKVNKLADANPVPDVRDAMKPRPKVRHFARLPAKRLPEFYGRLARSPADPVTKLALRWTILTMVRTNESRFFRPEEIEGRGTPDLLWRIPPERMKMGREHLVPLPRQAGPLLDAIEAIARKAGSPWQFPQDINPDKPISENCMLYALYDLGYKGTATVHGFRRMASTVLNEQLTPTGERLFDADWIEMQQARTMPGGSVRGGYNAAEYLGPRRRLLQFWASYLDQHRAVGELL